MASLATSKFLPFPEALVVARSRGLASKIEWRVWCKEGLRPRNVPATPDKIYKDQQEGGGHGQVRAHSVCEMHPRGEGNGSWLPLS